MYSYDCRVAAAPGTGAKKEDIHKLRDLVKHALQDLKEAEGYLVEGASPAQMNKAREALQEGAAGAIHEALTHIHKIQPK